MRMTADELARVLENSDVQVSDVQVIGDGDVVQAEVPLGRRLTGKANVRAGRQFEDELAGYFAELWFRGDVMAWKVDAKSRFIAPGRIIYETQPDMGPPINPPDFLGVWSGVPVALDAKTVTSTETYRVRDKSRYQHDGLRAFAKSPNAIAGYVIKWGDGGVTFHRVYWSDQRRVYRREDADLAGASTGALIDALDGFILDHSILHLRTQSEVKEMEEAL